MAIDLLGPLRIDGNEVSLQRRDEVVLSALALRPGCAMAADQLAGALWGDEPPPSWPKVVQGSLPYCPVWAYAERLGALLCGQGSGQVTAYDAMSGIELGRRFTSQLGGVCSLAISADGTSFAEASSCYGDATIIAWRLDGGGAVSRSVAEAPGGHRVQSFGLGDDPGALIAELAAGVDDEPVTNVLDPSTGEVLDRLPGIRELASTGDPERAVGVFTADGTVGWYDPTRRGRVGSGVSLGPDELYQMTVTGETVLVTQWRDEGHVVRGVDLVSGEFGPPMVDGGSTFEIWHVAIGRDAFYTAQAQFGGSGYRVQRHDLVTGSVLASVDGLMNVAARADTVIASTVDGRIVEVDPDSLETIGAPFPGTNGMVETLAIDSRGRRLLALGRDEGLRVYDIATRTQLGDTIDVDYDAELRNLVADLKDEVATAVLRGDGLMAAADTGQGIVAWDLDPSHWVDAACRLAGRNLTRGEWEQYIGDLAPYRATCPSYPTDP